MPLFDTQLVNQVLVARIARTVSSLAEPDVQPELDRLLAEIRAGAARHVLVDLSQAAYLGSTMLEMLRRVWRPVHAQGGQLAMCHVSDVSREALRVARFDTLWNVYASRDEALAGLAQAGA